MDVGIRRLTFLPSSISFKNLINLNGKSFSIFSPIINITNTRIFHTKLPLNPTCTREFASDSNVKDVDKNLAKKEKIRSQALKLEALQKVLLISEDNSISVHSLDEAQRIAKKRNSLMSLIDGKSEGLKTEKKVYKLTSKSDLLNKDEDNEESKKPKNDEKTLLIKSNISNNDALSKTKNLLKWVEKGMHVRVFISNIGKGDPENVYKIIENSIKETPYRIIQKVAKDSQIKFQVNPPKKQKIFPKKDMIDHTKEKDTKTNQKQEDV